jgi:ketosteroid isomerase-like protein
VIRLGRPRIIAWVALGGLAALAFAGAPVGRSSRIAHATPRGSALAASATEALRSVSDFSGIADPKARSAALLLEAMKVIRHPRCLNCHPADRVPTQGEHLHPHVPYLQAGVEGHGPHGLSCQACHQSENVATFSAPIRSVPGNPRWHLAPAVMAWQGKTPGEICRQLKDPSRNGGFSLEALIKHMAADPLVGWAWHPGLGREPAPGTQEQFGKLVAAWIETGAACPTEGSDSQEVPVTRDGVDRKAAGAARDEIEARNKALVEATFAAWRAGTGSPYDLLAEQASWTIVGRSTASKTYEGREAFVREVIRPFNARMRDPLKPSIRSIYAEGDVVIVFFDARATARDGQPYENTYAWFLELRDARIVKAFAFFDSVAFNELWRRVRLER